MNLYKKIFTEFKKSEIKYMIVGGVAVNLHGYSRFTGDIDILLALDKKNLRKLDELMHKLGYTERLPISVKDLGDSKKVDKFIKEKGMTAFTFVSSRGEQLDIDILAQESMDFDKYMQVQTLIEVWGIALPVINIDDLIEMKKAAGRGKDLIDIEALLKLKDS